MAQYSIATLGSELGFAEERLFLTRERGEQAYPLLAARLQETPEGEPLVLAFPLDQLMDSSFADESIVRLGEQIVKDEFGERCILLKGLSDDSITNIIAVISLRRLKLAFLVIEPDGGWRGIGHLEPSLVETLELVASRGRLTAPELAELRELTVNGANNRLKRLYDQRLVRREYEISDKGLQYIYRFWEWTEDLDDPEKG